MIIDHPQILSASTCIGQQVYPSSSRSGGQQFSGSLFLTLLDSGLCSEQLMPGGKSELKCQQEGGGSGLSLVLKISWFKLAGASHLFAVKMGAFSSSELKSSWNHSFYILNDDLQNNNIHFYLYAKEIPKYQLTGLVTMSSDCRVGQGSKFLKKCVRRYVDAPFL